jgi:hypothetical protein
VQKYDIFNAKVVKQNSDAYQIAVGLNLDTILSRDFLTAAQTALEPAMLQSLENNKAQMTEEEYEAAKIEMTGFTFDTMTDADLAEIKIGVSKVLDQVQGKYLITIGKTDKLIHSQSLNAVFDIAKIAAAFDQELPMPNAGKITLGLKVSYSDLNQPQTINTITEEVTDLSALMRAPVEIEAVEPDPLLNLMEGMETEGANTMGEDIIISDEIVIPTDVTLPSVSVPIPRPQ